MANMQNIFYENFIMSMVGDCVTAIRSLILVFDEPRFCKAEILSDSPRR